MRIWRKNILRNKIKRDGLAIPESVISYIAESVNESVRELDEDNRVLNEGDTVSMEKLMGLMKKRRNCESYRMLRLS